MLELRQQRCDPGLERQLERHSGSRNHRDHHPAHRRPRSAIVATLAPGAYTAIVSGVNDTTGVGLVEAYNLQ
jgi:hypothetical protein